MSVAKADYRKYRDALWPLILNTEKHNQHSAAQYVDKALLNGRAFLFISDECFFVLEPCKDELGIIFAFSFGGHSCEKFQPVVEELARKIGSKSLYFLTTLRGFAIIAKNMGYKKESKVGNITKWVKEVPYGWE